MMERQKIKSDNSTADPVPILNNINEFGVADECLGIKLTVLLLDVISTTLIYMSGNVGIIPVQVSRPPMSSSD